MYLCVACKVDSRVPYLIVVVIDDAANFDWPFKYLTMQILGYICIQIKNICTVTYLYVIFMGRKMTFCKCRMCTYSEYLIFEGL
jgi:hypothetical protein